MFFVDISISEQIKSISVAAYLLFYLFKKNSTSLMPAQLYYDLQTTFIDAVFCCAKIKEFSPLEPFYLVLNGTDPLERFFGNVRMAYRGGNYNVLDMINSARSMAACDKLIDHQNWIMKNRVQCRLSLDYSSPGNWNKDSLILEKVNISATWRNGFTKLFHYYLLRILR